MFDNLPPETLASLIDAGIAGVFAIVTLSFIAFMWVVGKAMIPAFLQVSKQLETALDGQRRWYESELREERESRISLVEKVANLEADLLLRDKKIAELESEIAIIRLDSANKDKRIAALQADLDKEREERKLVSNERDMLIGKIVELTKRIETMEAITPPKTE